MGAELHIKNDEGKTPLDTASESDYKEIIELIQSKSNERTPDLENIFITKEDDEPLTPEEEAEIEMNRKAYMSGDKGIPWEEAQRELLENSG